MCFTLFFRPTIMKRIFITMCLVSAFLLRTYAQKDKIYGFQQQVIAGAKSAGDIDENGRLIKKKTKDANRYLIYLTTSSKTKIYPVQLWINGEAFSVDMQEVINLPVVQPDTNTPADKAKTLVPQTGAKVYQLTPVPLMVDKSNGKAKALALSNAVVVLYKTAGKQQYGLLKKFTRLDPVSLQ